MNDIDRNEITSIVQEMFSDGKEPTDVIGLSWEDLSGLEKAHPEITLRQSNTSAENRA